MLARKENTAQSLSPINTQPAFYVKPSLAPAGGGFCSSQGLLSVASEVPPTALVSTLFPTVSHVFTPLFCAVTLSRVPVPSWLLCHSQCPSGQAQGSRRLTLCSAPRGTASEGEGLGTDGQEHKEDTFDVFRQRMMQMYRHKRANK